MVDLNAWGRQTSSTGSKDAEPHTGTTIVACTYNGGVVLGADGRVSTGNYVSNRASNKIMQLTDNVFLCRSGSAADTQAIGDYGGFCETMPRAAYGTVHGMRRCNTTRTVLLACPMPTGLGQLYVY